MNFYSRIALVFGCIAALITGLESSTSVAERIPFPDALDDAIIRTERLDSILEHALILGNGDINALLYSEQGQLKLALTKNDVWDARLDSKLDPPIPTLALIKRLGKRPPTSGGSAAMLSTGWSQRGADSYHAHPYPCPRACAKLSLGDAAARPYWRPIRARGKHNAWEVREAGAVMSIEGNAEASNGYSLSPLGVKTGEGHRLRVTIRGTPNARFYIDVMNEQSQNIFKSGWLETPTKPEERTFDLPAGKTVDRVILYTWTEDGRRAENYFQEVVIERGGRRQAIDLTAETVEIPEFSGRLDLRRAAATASGPITAKVRALAGRNVFLIRSPASATIEATPSADTPEAEMGKDAEVRWLTQQLPGDADWPGMSFAVALAERGEWKAVAIVTSREAKDPRSAATQLARATLNQPTPELIVQHEAVWHEFWAKSGVQIDDSFLCRTWYRNLYFLRCVSKPGVISPGLFASLINASPAWHGDYHTNYNLQQTFWTAFNTNHPELAEPYDRLMTNYLPRASWLCRQIFSFDGAFFPHVIFAYEPPNPAHCKSPVGRQYIHHVWGFTMGVPAFTVQPIWWHYKYQPDRRMLERTAYPTVREVALFQVNFMDQCDTDRDGNLILGPTISPEHWGWTEDFVRNRNSTFDIAMFRYVFEAAIEGATMLDRDEGLVARWRNALLRLPPYPTANDDRPVVVDVQDAPPITYNIAIPAVPVFPGDVVTWFSPTPEKELFKRSIANCRWNGNNSVVILSVARARLSMPNTSEWMRGEFKARTRPNGTLTLNRLGHGLNSFGHYTEQFAASMAIGELFVQSVGDIIRVFPAWPADGDASFRDLRAQGGFLVSGEQINGTVTRLEIVSTAGGPLRVLSPWKTIAANGRPLAKDSAGVVKIPTNAGDRITLSPGNLGGRE